MKYYIWSHERNMWWKPNSWGYTFYLFEAGLYSAEEADKICADANKYSNKKEESMFGEDLFRA